MEGVGFVGGGLALGSRPSAAAARCGRTTVSMGAESVKNRNRRVGIVDKVGVSWGLGRETGVLQARKAAHAVIGIASCYPDNRGLYYLSMQVREQLDKSTLAFALPLEGYTVKEVSELRNVIPENSCALAVKNTLFRIAIADSTWDVAGDLTKGSNLWIFTEEADMKGTVSTLAQSFWNATAICPF
uniref:Uncharacterized protein n=1 Tax=Rhodosorus marinus TaxID=101924 RepID=A0A7S2ZKU9_9RHOD|mmetsp:Transcript_23208/g.92603  ORF Transcript_23208/g.92603 Transcript_23208/m.92603 type:complete len:186 (+) Transcript_23208:204-761(+)